MSLLKEAPPVLKAEVPHKKKRIIPGAERAARNTAAVSKIDLLSPKPVFTFNGKGEIAIFSFADPEKSSGLAVNAEVKNRGGLWGKLRSRRNGADVVADNRPNPDVIVMSGGGGKDGGNTPVDRGFDDSGWNDNERKVAAIFGENGNREVGTVSLLRDTLSRFIELTKRKDPFKETRSDQHIIDDRLTHALAVVDETFERVYELKDGRDTAEMRAQAHALAEGGRQIERVRSLLKTDNDVIFQTQDAIKKIPTTNKSFIAIAEFFKVTKQTYQFLESVAADIPSKTIFKEIDTLLEAEDTAFSMDAYAVGRGVRGVRRQVQAIDAIPLEERKVKGAQQDRFWQLEQEIEGAGRITRIIRNTYRSTEK